MMVEDGLPPSAVSGRQTIFHHHRILKGRRQERGHVCASTVSAVLCCSLYVLPDHGFLMSVWIYSVLMC